MPDAKELITRIRTKYKGAYDDLSDSQLAQKVYTRYPDAYPELKGFGVQNSAGENMKPRADTKLPYYLSTQPMTPPVEAKPNAAHESKIVSLMDPEGTPERSTEPLHIGINPLNPPQVGLSYQLAKAAEKQQGIVGSGARLASALTSAEGMALSGAVKYLPALLRGAVGLGLGGQQVKSGVERIPKDPVGGVTDALIGAAAGIGGIGELLKKAPAVPDQPNETVQTATPAVKVSVKPKAKTPSRVPSANPVSVADSASPVLANKGAKGAKASEAPPVGEVPPTDTESVSGDPAKGTGRYRHVYKVDRDLGNAVNKAASSTEQANLSSTLAKRNVLGSLDDTQRAALGEYLVSKRLREVNPKHPQILKRAEEKAILQDPKIASALEQHKLVKTEIEELRLKAGLKEDVAKSKSPEFVSLIAEEMPEGSPRPGGTTAQKLRKTGTRFRNQALGEKEAYSTDLGKIYDTSFNEVTQKANLNDVISLAGKKKLLSDKPKEGWQPEEVWTRPTVMEDGSRVMVPVKRYMPAELAEAIRDIRLTTPDLKHPIIKALQQAQSVNTGLSLTANPAELFNHMRRVGEAFSNLPPADKSKGLRVVEPLLPWIGPKVGAAHRLFSMDMSTPENQSVMRQIFDANAGSNRAFHEYQSAIPGLGNIQKFSHDLLFSIPEGKGVKGFDMRVRVAAEKIRRAVEGNADPQRIRDFANQFGQYTGKPDKIVEIVKHLNPYAATNLPLRTTEFRQVLGGTGLKAKSFGQASSLRGETLLRGIGGTVLGMTLLNKALSGHYPWENPSGNEYMVDTGMSDSDGKNIYVDPRFFSPMFARVANTIGLKQITAETKAKNKDLGEAALTGPANQLANILVSPLSNSVTTLLTGYAPYLSKRPGEKMELLDLAKGEKGSNRQLNKLKAGARGLNPLGHLITGDVNERYEMKGPVPRVINYLSGGVLKKPYATEAEKKRERNLQRSRH